MYSIPSLRGLLSETGPAPVTGPFPFYADNQIRAQAVVGDNIYIAGDFTSVGKYSDLKTFQFCILNSTNANANYSSINRTLFNADVKCFLISGSYIYVGGSFTVYNNQACERIAKISLVDGSLDTTFNSASGFDAAVQTISLDGFGNLYAGGQFIAYKGTTRQYIAKINATTAALDTTFDSASGFNASVESIAVDGSGNLYAGGSFVGYKGTTRQYIAKINATTAALDTTFDSASGFNASNAVKSIALDGSGNLYVGGRFTAYKGTTRQRIAKINATTAALDATFDSTSGFSADVESIALDGSGNLYAGGQFTGYKTITRNYIAKINATTAALDTTFDSASGFNLFVFSIALDGSGNLYAGGLFSTYKGTAREYIAKINATTAALDTTFDSASGFKSGAVQRITLDGSGNLYAGGAFTNYKTLNQIVTRQRIAKISLLTGNIDTTFDSASGFDSGVESFVLDGSGSIYAGGGFLGYKGTSRQRIAKINATTAALDTTFDSTTGFNSTVNSIVLDNTSVYAGGAFTTYKGTARERIAKINKTTAGLDTTFDSATGFDDTVLSIANDGFGGIYAAGRFLTYKGIARQRIAKLVYTTGALDTEFDSASGFGGIVNAIIISGVSLIAVGLFRTYKGLAAESIAKISRGNASRDSVFDTSTGFANPPSVVTSTTPNSIALDSSGNVYVGGVFTTYKGTPTIRLAKINGTTAALDTTFNTSTGFDVTVRSIVFDGSGNVYLGGGFSTYKTFFTRRAAIIDATTAAAKGY